MSDLRRDLKQRFAAKFEIDEATGCWNWTASKGRRGYGWIWIGDRKASNEPR